jgi:hypothetical protein
MQGTVLATNTPQLVLAIFPLLILTRQGTVLATTPPRASYSPTPNILHLLAIFPLLIYLLCRAHAPQLVLAIFPLLRTLTIQGTLLATNTPQLIPPLLRRLTMQGTLLATLLPQPS